MPAADRDEGRWRGRLALWTLLTGASLVMASTTCVTAAIPEIATELAATQTQVQWIADLYPVVLAALLLPAGALLDRFGRRRGLVAGLVLLAAALAWSWQAASAEQLIASRGLSGVGAALVFPATLASITATVRRGRGRAVALWAAAVMAGGGYGLVLGGAMVETASWGAAFGVMALLAGACAVPALLAVPETRDREASSTDVIGAVLAVVAVGSLTAGIIEWPVKGLGDPLVWATLAGGAASTAAFALWELRHPAPMLEVRLLADRVFGSATFAILTMFGAAFGWFFLSFQYYAYVLGWGPLESSLGLLPNIVPLVALAPLGTRAAERFGRRAVISVALATMAAGAVVTALAGASREFWPVAAGFALIGAGGGLGQGPATQAIVDALPAAKQGVASAVNDLSRELGAAVGIAAVGSAFTAGYRAHAGDAAAGTYPAVVTDSPAAALKLAASDPALSGLVEVVRQATVAGWLLGMLAAAGVLLAGAAWVAVRMPGGAVAVLPRFAQLGDGAADRQEA